MHRTARLLAVFAVLAGLLAMHGMRGEHSAMGGQVRTASTVEPARMAMAVSAGAFSAVTGVLRPAQPAMTSMATACLAIRNPGLTPGPRGCAMQTAAGMTYRGALEPPAARARPALRPPDLVAGLCVSRT